MIPTLKPHIVKLYIVSSISNIADFLTSAIAFMHGCTELNMWVVLLGLNRWVALYLAVITYQLITLALLLLTPKTIGFTAVTTLTIIKAVVAVHNLLLTV